MHIPIGINKGRKSIHSKLLIVAALLCTKEGSHVSPVVLYVLFEFKKKIYTILVQF